MHHYLNEAFPTFGAALPRLPLAQLPTPVESKRVLYRGKHGDILIKHDDISGAIYGGNKIRKLEYLLGRARARDADTVATFGTVGSNHAVATALCAVNASFRCICFLGHQRRKPEIANALRLHQQLGVEVVALSGERRARIATLRQTLRGRKVNLIPLGGTSWLGTLGFVNAGFEFARQVEAGECVRPARVYVAFGTMGTAVGLALGFALAGLDVETQAVRVTETRFANPDAAARLINKTATLLHRIDSNVPADLAERTQLVCREGYFGGGYSHPTPEAESAIEFAADTLGIQLESTYTGKAMAALLDDLKSAKRPSLFWHTYNSRPLPVDADLQPDFNVLPPEFARYFD